MSSASAGIERRQFGRRSVCKKAVIVQGSGQRIDCVVVDISEGGVRIRCGDTGTVSAEFDLEIEVDDFAVKCAVVHVQTDSLGARFIQSPTKLSWLKRRSDKNRE